MKGWLRRMGRRSRNRPMDCHQVGSMLQHYLDGELDEDRAARITAHLEECRRCGLEADAYEQIKASLGGRRPAVPADSLERLRAFGRGLVEGTEHPHPLP